MALLTIIEDAVRLDIGGLNPAIDVSLNGILTEGTTGNVHAVPAGGAVFNQGLLLTNAGQVRYVDATAGLPVNTVWSNGLPSSDGALCISTGALANYSNGMPFVANGAVRAGILV